jgi:hypothetical protein
MAATHLFGFGDQAGTRRKNRLGSPFSPRMKARFLQRRRGVSPPPHPRRNKRLMIPSGPVWPPNPGESLGAREPSVTDGGGCCQQPWLRSNCGYEVTVLAVRLQIVIAQVKISGISITGAPAVLEDEIFAGPIVADQEHGITAPVWRRVPSGHLDISAHAVASQETCTLQGLPNIINVAGPVPGPSWVSEYPGRPRPALQLHRAKNQGIYSFIGCRWAPQI